MSIPAADSLLEEGEPSSRLFVALWPAPAVRQELQAWLQGWHWPSRAGPVTPESLHLTLHFLGQVANARIAELRHGVAVPFTPFELNFSHPTLWSHGIAVLLPDSVPSALLDLQAAVGVELLRMGLPVEKRAFRPHVTLSRRADGAAAPGEGPLVRWPVREYALVLSSPGRSRHEPNGYAVLETYPA
ncbi:MAG: RNA 2',3'-cyclic phosphodiesterase [Burkholderiaceae bacterium]|nr:RNA 2',3'-cyclic phosphodiesterase [Burkholderiaceae bacterium]